MSSQVNFRLIGWTHSTFVYFQARFLLGILIPFVAFVISVIGMTVLFTWVFNHTCSSIGLSILLHASINTTRPCCFCSFHPLKGPCCSA